MNVRARRPATGSGASRSCPPPRWSAWRCSRNLWPRTRESGTSATGGQERMRRRTPLSNDSGLVQGRDPLRAARALVLRQQRDGIGDFNGLAQKLDYLEDLGVNTLWLLPFLPVTMRDDGSRHRGLRRRCIPTWNARRLPALLEEAHRRGLRVVTELVINHQRISTRGSAPRRRHVGTRSETSYVWRRTRRRLPPRGIISGFEKSNYGRGIPVAKSY